MNLLDKIIEEFADNEDLIKKKFGFTARSLTPFETQEAKKMFSNGLQRPPGL